MLAALAKVPDRDAVRAVALGAHVLEAQHRGLQLVHDALDDFRLERVEAVRRAFQTRRPDVLAALRVAAAHRHGDAVAFAQHAAVDQVTRSERRRPAGGGRRAEDRVRLDHREPADVAGQRVRSESTPRANQSLSPASPRSSKGSMASAGRSPKPGTASSVAISAPAARAPARPACRDLGAVAGAQRLDHRRNVGLHGAEADPQHPADLGVREPLGDQLEHFELPVGQPAIHGDLPWRRTASNCGGVQLGPDRTPRSPPASA